MAGVVSVDYLGRWERTEEVATAADVMRSLLRSGLQGGGQFVPHAELYLREEEITLLDTNDNNRPEVWSFLSNQVCEPVAFVNKRNAQTGFTRVVIFTVLGEGHFNRNPVFIALQCLEPNDPTELVERLLLLSGEIRSRKESAATMPSLYGETGNFASVHRRMSSTSSFQPDGEGTLRSGREQFRKPIPFQSPRVPDMVARSPDSLGFDKPSFLYDHSQDPVQKDTILLNYCIDDIENLCMELREARAALSPEGSEQPPGSTRPLNSFIATEFTSTFQKFKLAFNLLARSSEHLVAPNSSDLSHHLLPPLAFLMDAAQDLFDDEIYKEVASPFLTKAAITLLRACLTSREIGIWEACGDYWTRSKDDFDAPAGPYKPIFNDGWSPGYIVFSDSPGAPQPSGRQRQGGRQHPPAQIQSKSDSESDYGSDGSVYNISKYRYTPEEGSGHRTGGQEAWRDLLIKKGADIALVTFTRESSNRRELSVVKGDYVEVLGSERKWWKVRSKEQEIGFVPYTILKSLVYKDASEIYAETQRKLRPSPRRSPSPRQRRSPSPRRRRSPSPRHSPRRASSRRKSPSPERPPSPAPSVVPPPPPQPRRVEETPTILRKTKRQRERSNSVETSYSMADELKNVLSYYKEEKGRKSLDILQTPEIFLDQRSTWREVKEWLQAKQFTSNVLRQMEGMAGRQVLSMEREQLEKAFGKEEGGRLNSQIILSRNMTKYTQGKGSQLRTVLEKARQRSEKKKEREDFEEDFDALGRA